MRLIAMMIVIAMLGACTFNMLAGNCTRIVTEMDGGKQVQEGCR